MNETNKKLKNSLWGLMLVYIILVIINKNIIIENIHSGQATTMIQTNDIIETEEGYIVAGNDPYLVYELQSPQKVSYLLLNYPNRLYKDINIQVFYKDVYEAFNETKSFFVDMNDKNKMDLIKMPNEQISNIRIDINENENFLFEIEGVTIINSKLQFWLSFFFSKINILIIFSLLIMGIFVYKNYHKIYFVFKNIFEKYISLILIYLRKNKIIPKFFIVSSSIVILFIDCKLVNDILEKDKSYYEVTTQEKKYYRINDSCIVSNFISVSDDILEYKIYCSNITPEINGNVSYLLEDKNGNILYKNSSDIDNLISEDNSTLIFDLEGTSLNVGQEYIFKFDVQVDNGFDIEMNSNDGLHVILVFTPQFKYILLFMLIIFNICIVYIYYYIMKLGWNNNLVCIISLVTGISIAICIAPCSMDDEYRHFIRAYDIANGNILTKYQLYEEDSYGNVFVKYGGTAPYAEVEDEINLLRLLDKYRNYNEKSYLAENNGSISIEKFNSILQSNITGRNIKVSIEATDSISVFAYIPQIIAIKVGQLIGVRPILLYYFARVGNVIVSSFILWLLLCLLPNRRLLIMAVFFSPYYLMLRSSCSTDSLLVSLVMLDIAYILYLRENTVKLNIKSLIIIVVISIYISVIKLPYVLVLVSLLTITKDNYSKETSRLKAIVYNIILLGSMVLISLIGYLLIARITTSQFYNILSDEEIITMNATSENAILGFTDTHIQYIIDNFIGFVNMICTEIGNISRYKIAITGWQYSLGNTYYYAILLLFLLKKRDSVLNKFVYLVTILIIWCTVFLVGFTWGKPDIGYIWGVSGRYYIPLLFMTGLVLPVGNNNTEKISLMICPYLIMHSTFVSTLNWFQINWI